MGNIDLKNQYLKALDLYDSENTRFWTRFNVFSGLQLVVIAGIASSFPEFLQHKHIAILMISTALIFSIFTVIVMWRSKQIGHGIVKAICDLEGKDNSCIVLSTYMRATKSPMGIINGYCVLVSIFLTLFWFSFLIITILV